MADKKNVNLRDIAKQAGVTPMTVSLVLRNKPRVSDKTRKKVLKIAKQLGYRANPMVTSLMSQVASSKRIHKRSQLALVCPQGNYRLLMQRTYPYASDMIAAMRQRSYELGYEGIEVFEPETKEDSFEKVCRVIHYRGIRGVILPPFANPFLDLDFDIDLSKLAVVAAGHSQRIQGVHRVAHNNFQITFQLTQYAINLGYKRIGITLDEEYEKRTGWHYTGGFLGAIRMNTGVWKHWDCVKYRSQVKNDYESKLVEWCRKHRFDCVISWDPADYMTLRNAAYQIPGDIGFAMLTTDQSDRKYVDNPSGMLQDPVEIGRASVDLLTAQINRNEYGKPEFPKLVLTEPKLVEGSTL